MKTRTISPVLCSEYENRSSKALANILIADAASACSYETMSRSDHCSTNIRT
jgi:hypothetical protein